MASLPESRLGVDITANLDIEVGDARFRVTGVDGTNAVDFPRFRDALRARKPLRDLARRIRTIPGVPRGFPFRIRVGGRDLALATLGANGVCIRYTPLRFLLG